MIIDALRQIKKSLILLILFTILTGIIYPIVVTIVAQLFFSWSANGSLIGYNDQKIGSMLIGQYFDANNYFWSRPSATTPQPYNGASSSGSNWGPANPDFLTTVKTRIDFIKRNNPNKNLLPIDLVTASASGLDPEISLYAAYYQVSRIARVSRIPENEIAALIANLIKGRTFGVLGEPRVNVLELNIALDKIRSAHGRKAS